MQVPRRRNGQNCRNYLQKCRYGALPSGGRPSADDLLVLLAVGRSGRYTTAAEELGLNHTTISRRIAALEQSIGGRVLARVGRRVGADRSRSRGAGGRRGRRIRGALARRRCGRLASPRRGGADLGDRWFQRLHRRTGGGAGAAQASEGGRGDRRGHPARHPAALGPRHRGGGRRTAGAPGRGDPPRRLLPGAVRLPRLPDRTRHPRRASKTWRGYPLVYFIDSMLQVDDLDLATSFAPAMRESVTSTNVFVHVEATRAAAGIGLLPCFMADRHDDLVRVLPESVAVRLSYWLVDATGDAAPAGGGCRCRGDPTGWPTSATCLLGAR